VIYILLFNSSKRKEIKESSLILLSIYILAVLMTVLTRFLILLELLLLLTMPLLKFLFTDRTSADPF